VPERRYGDLRRAGNNGDADPVDAITVDLTGPLARAEAGVLMLVTRPPVASPAALPAGQSWLDRASPTDAVSPGVREPPAPLAPSGRHPARWPAVWRSALVAAASAAALAGAVGRLWPAVRAQQPTAYLLTALLAGVLAMLVRGRARWHEPDIHDRQIDYLVGLPLLGAALFVLAALPGRFGAGFWNSHADLLGAPFLLAGAVTLVFGTRTLWRLRTPLALLTVALVPYSPALAAAVSHALARPVLALATAAAGPLSWWNASAAGPNGVLVQVPGDGAQVLFTNAMTGCAGPLAGLVTIVLLTASASRWSAALRRAAGLLSLGLALLGLRLYLALMVGAGGPDAARAVLGPAGDGVALAVLLAAGGALAWRAERQPHPKASQPLPRKRPVERARVAMALVLATALTMGWLGQTEAVRTDLTRAAEGWVSQ
jgi:hypothetical protein